MPSRRKLFDPNSNEPFAISRTGIEEFVRCPRCFYLRRRLGLAPPRMVPLTLAVATDALLKEEFDQVREAKQRHPVWDEFGLNVRAFNHEAIDLWRNNFKGIRHLHEPTNLEIFGAVDDVWEHLETSELHIVDYKSTSKQGDPSIEGGGFADGYKRQMEIYQWLFRKEGFEVSDEGYFLYVNGSKTGPFYGQNLTGTMRFKTTLITYHGQDTWVENTLSSAKACLMQEKLPDSGHECDNCRYYSQRSLQEKFDL